VLWIRDRESSCSRDVKDLKTLSTNVVAKLCVVSREDELAEIKELYRTPQEDK